MPQLETSKRIQVSVTSEEADRLIWEHCEVVGLRYCDHWSAAEVCYWCEVKGLECSLHYLKAHAGERWGIVGEVVLSNQERRYSNLDVVKLWMLLDSSERWARETTPCFDVKKSQTRRDIEKQIRDGENPFEGTDFMSIEELLIAFNRQTDPLARELVYQNLRHRLRQFEE